MKDFKFIFILFLSLKMINNTCISNTRYQIDYAFDESASVKSCAKRTISPYEYEEYDAYKCCYFHSRCPPNTYQPPDSNGLNETRICTVLSQEEYENIDFLIKEKEELGCSGVDIICNSLYLKLAFIISILILLY